MNSLKTLLITLAITLAITTTFLVGCSSETESTPKPTTAPTAAPTATKPPTGEIVYGIATPLSGPAAPWGIPHARAAELVFDMVNEAGGLEIDGTIYTLKVKAYDTKFILADTVAAANRLIDEGVQYMSFIDPVGPVTDLLAENNILSINIGGQWYLVNKDKPLQFLAIPSMDQTGAAFYPYLAEQYPDIETRAAIMPDTETGHFVGAMATYACDWLGIDTIHEEFFQSTSVDFPALALRILSKNPDWVDPIPPPPNESALMLKHLREAGYDGLFGTSISIGEVGTYVGIAGAENAEGVMAWGIAPDAYTPEVMDWKERYIAKYGGPFDPMTIMWANAAFTLVDGLKHANSLDPADVANALRAPDFRGDTLMGAYTYGGEDVYGIGNQIIQDYIPFHIIGPNGADQHLLNAKAEDYMPVVNELKAVKRYVTEEMGLEYP